METTRIRLGNEVLLDRLPGWLRSHRLGLLVNQASVTRSLEFLAPIIRRAGGNLRCIFSPQHGFNSEKQANMKESSDEWDSALDIPIFSLYGGVRQPTADMMNEIDVLVADLQDVGTRVYTYGATLGLCLEVAAKAGVKMVVLDRPNPIGGLRVEGNVVKTEYRSFVGRYPIPMRHGLTMGEFARFVAKKCGDSCDLEVVPMEGWKRRDHYPDTDLQWVYPSPNMPSWETALLYPGMVLLEGTNVSEGRGTTLPFHLFGAPFVRQPEMKAWLDGAGLEGVVFRPISFQPAFDKWEGEVCRGFQIHVTERDKLCPYRLGLVLLQGLCLLHGEDFAWLPPPYEYEREKLPIDILLGDGDLRKKLEAGEAVGVLEGGWLKELAEYRSDCEDCLIYE